MELNLNHFGDNAKQPRNLLNLVVVSIVEKLKIKLKKKENHKPFMFSMVSSCQ